MTVNEVQFLLHLADNSLILGHRNSEWCGHGPVLEQDIAISNCSLDLLGQARNFYQMAAACFNALPAVEKKNFFLSPLIAAKIDTDLTEDDLAYLRDTSDYYNYLLCELPKGHWGYTILRQYIFAVYQKNIFTQLHQTSHEQLLGIVAKAIKEVSYHISWTSGWVQRLGDGTDESNQKMQEALEQIWPYAQELMHIPAYAGEQLKSYAEEFTAEIINTLQLSNLKIPNDNWKPSGGPQKLHTEHLSYLLAEMQQVHRTYPGVNW
jgi:ring-1,2-phenylacetyl-CoA epoxidase subunit PaaC